jgi:hypothetical protein
MGFADGLRELLGGFNAVRRIDQDGFDWREKDAAAQFERDRARQLAGQQDEDRAAGQLTDYLSAQDLNKEPDLSGAEPLLRGIDAERRKALVGTAIGRRRQAKDAIAERKAQSDVYLQALRNRGGVDRVMTAAAAAEPAREDTQKHQEEMQARRLEAAALIAAARGGKEYRPYPIQLPDGTMGYWDPNNPSGAVVPMNGPDGSPIRKFDPNREKSLQGLSSAMTLYDDLATKGGALSDVSAEDYGGFGGLVAKAQGMKQRGAAALGLDPQAEQFTKESRGFVPMLARAAGHSGVLTELDVSRTEGLLPQIGDSVEVRKAKDTAMRKVMKAVYDAASNPAQARVDLLQKLINDEVAAVSSGAPSAPATPQPGSPQPTPQGGGQHGPPVKRKRMPDGSTMFRDAQGNTWQE